MFLTSFFLYYITTYLDCVDDEEPHGGYECKDYTKFCRSDYTGDWYEKFRAACNSTCNLYASEYCGLNTCKGLKPQNRNILSFLYQVLNFIQLNSGGTYKFFSHTRYGI